MPDLVGTCPKDFWEEWIAEGDAASDKGTVFPSITGNDWSWCTRDRKALSAGHNDRFYVVAHGRLRGWAPIIRVDTTGDGGFEIIRRGGAVAVTVPFPIPGFRGLRTRWWSRDVEFPFGDWKKP